MFISKSVAESLPLSSSPSFGAKVPQPLKQGQWLRGSLLLSWLAYLDYLAAAVEPATAAHPRQAAKRPASLGRCHGPPKRGTQTAASCAIIGCCRSPPPAPSLRDGWSRCTWEPSLDRWGLFILAFAAPSFTVSGRGRSGSRNSSTRSQRRTPSRPRERWFAVAARCSG